MKRRRKARPITQKDRQEVARFRKDGMSFAEIGELVDRDPETTRRMYKDYVSKPHSSQTDTAQAETVELPTEQPPKKSLWKRIFG